MAYWGQMDSSRRVENVGLHEQQPNPYSGWSAADCVAETERLLKQYNQWKYPDADTRLQRVVTVIQRKAR
jgi:hypothetical protein